MKNLFNFLSAFIMALFFAFILNLSMGVELTVGIAIAIAISLLMGVVNHKYHNSLRAGLLKEIWLAQIMEKFYAEAGHLVRSKDLSSFVDNNTINLADAGVDPEVLVNNNTYPIPFAERTDTPIALPLNRYTTEGTVVRNPDQVERSYNMMESHVYGHRNKLIETTAAHATHAWTPNADGAFTPILQATGATSSTGTGKKALTLKDIAKAQYRLDKLKVPAKGRILVLCPEHRADILAEDINLFKAFTNLKVGEVLPLFGFDVYFTQLTAIFNRSTGVKKAFNAAAAPSTDTYSSLFYHEGEVMRADGTLDMNDEERKVTEGGTIINFEKRFLGLSIREKYNGAIISDNA